MSELKVTAISSKGERRIIEHTLPIPLEEIDSLTLLECGLHQEHMSGDDKNGTEVTLDSGAGCGNPWITATIKFPDDEKHYFRIDGQLLLAEILELAKKVRE